MSLPMMAQEALFRLGKIEDANDVRLKAKEGDFHYIRCALTMLGEYFDRTTTKKEEPK